MSKDRPSMRGRGDEILGRGVDALFSSPAARPPAPQPETAAADADLDRLLASEAQSAISGVGGIPDAPPSPIRSTALDQGAIAGGGVLISDEELLREIETPLTRTEEIVIEPPLDDLAIDVPLPAEPVPAPGPSEAVVSPPSPVEPSLPPPTPLPAPLPASSRPAAPAPRPAAPAPARPAAPAAPVSPPRQPLTPPTPAPSRPASGAGSRPTFPGASIAPAAPASGSSLPPDRPRVSIGGPLTEVAVAPGELDAANVRPLSPFEPRPEQVIEDPLAHPQRSDEDLIRLLSQVDPKRIAALNKEIDRLYSDIPDRISNRPDLSGQAMGLLRRARTTLFESPQDFVEAEYLVKQATLIYNRIENSEKWGDKYGWRVFYYEIIALIIFLISFLLLLAFGDPFSNYLVGLVKGKDVLAEILKDPAQWEKLGIPGVFTAVGFWATLVWGGIGGVVGALYILWTHISERQDFERQHVMWYIVQPILGLILGGVTFLIIYTGLLTFQASEPVTTALAKEIQLFPCLVAFIAGFRPQFIFGLLTKIIKIINPTENERSA